MDPRLVLTRHSLKDDPHHFTPTLSARQTTSAPSNQTPGIQDKGYANSRGPSHSTAGRPPDNAMSGQNDGAVYDTVNFALNSISQESEGEALQAEVTLQVSGKAVSDLKDEEAYAHETPSEGVKPYTLHKSSTIRRRSISIKLERIGERGKYLLKADDPELREVLHLGLQRDFDGKDTPKRSRFSDLVFTKQFTTFDRQNPAAASSPFHGFFTLFWLSVFFMLVKVASNNWKVYGSIFGPSEILTLMFSHDVVLLGATDLAMMSCTAFCLLLQKAVLAGYLSWNKQGWIIQNIWQTLYLGSVIGFTIHRSWSWPHTIFIVLHCIVMLMKQHSYAFYNGYLSEAYKRKRMLEQKLSMLQGLDCVNSPSVPNSPNTPATASSYFDAEDMNKFHRRRRSMNAKSSPQLLRTEESDIAKAAVAIESGGTLDFGQVESFKRIISWEIANLEKELHGKCSETGNSYPKNLNIKDFAGYIPLPTVVYELEYPRQDHINWYYVAEKTVATFGVLAVMTVISQAYIYPAVILTVDMKANGMTFQERLAEFPWIFSDLLFPLMLEYILTWYVIWECILNVLAEVTLFADRGFYADWWNSVSWDQFARDWNRPVHNFLLRHVYHSSISAFSISRPSATLITFLLSACVHELVMWCIFKKLRGYLMAAQMLQLPLVMLSRTKLLKGRSVLGNVVFWLGLFTGPSFLATLYLIM